MSYSSITLDINSSIRNKTTIKSISTANVADRIQDVLDFANAITGGGSSDRFGIEDNTGVQDRSISMGNFELSISGASDFNLQAQNFFSSSVGNNSFIQFQNEIILNVPSSDGTRSSSIYVNQDGGINGIRMATADPANHRVELFLKSETGRTYIVRDLGTERDIALSVNGNFADSTGDITVSTGGGSGWGLTGNAGTDASTNFIGTTDNVDFIFRVNGKEAFRNIDRGSNGPVTVWTGEYDLSQKYFFIAKEGLEFASPVDNLSSQYSAYGLILPRYTTTSRDTLNYNIQAIVIYNDTVNAPQYYNGTTWVTLGSGAAGSSGWNLTGNSGTNPSTNFIGTTDGQFLKFRVNNINNGYIGLPADGNIGLGYTTLGSITSGTFNTSFGYNTMVLATSAGSNSAFGSSSLAVLTTGTNNTGIGTSALRALTSGTSNTCTGVSSLRFLTSGTFNSAFGTTALNTATTGGSNVAFGSAALFTLTTANFNSAFGVNALKFVTTGIDNVGIGYSAGQGLTVGNDNTIIGKNTRFSNDGSSNTIIGRSAGYNSTGDGNVFLGYSSGYNSTGNNKLYIDNTSTATPLIYGEFDTPKLIFGGSVNLRTYGTGTHTGTATYNLATDASGNIIEVAASGGGSASRFGVSGEDDLNGSGNRAIDMQGNELKILNSTGSGLFEYSIGDITNFTGSYAWYKYTLNGFNLTAHEDSTFADILIGCNTATEQIDININGIAGASGIQLLPSELLLNNNNGKYVITNILSYASNAAAITGGLVAGNLYRNGDNLCIVH